jgi:preprotein translocase subunit SecE
MSKIVSYFENAYDELLHKVTWPSWKELQETTAIVMYFGFNHYRFWYGCYC